jgi:predicted dehydrogenase
MHKVRVGVVGAGYWGPNLIRNFHEIPEAELAGVCELRPERQEHIRQRYPHVPVYTRLAELLAADVEAIAIASQVSSHHTLALECLAAGKHILVEKPLAASSAEARQIIAAGEAAGRVVMTGHTFIYNPAVQALRQIIASGEIGEVFYVNATRVNLGLFQKDINVVWDLAPHDVSIMLYILGMEPVSASARGGRYINRQVHDVAYLTVFFPGEVMADVRVSWLDPNKIRRFNIVGSKKMLVYDDIAADHKVLVYDKGVDKQPYSDTLEEFHLAYRYGEPTPYPLEWQEPLRLECLDFVRCVGEGGQPLSDGLMGLKVVQVLEAAQASLNNGGTKEAVLW